MCLILLAWKAHPDYPLVVAANRDEFFARPSAPAAFWAQSNSNSNPNSPQLLAGRDLEAGGTWLGVSRQGRFAALTNYREGGQALPQAPSRGALVADYLAGNTDADAYLAQLAARGADYKGFNLFVGDGDRLGYYSNRDGAPRWLSPGIYGLSNHLLDTPWPKLASAKAEFSSVLHDLPAEDALLDLLADREIVADPHLPQTGVPLAWERILSAIFVAAPDYGTRASTLLMMRKDGRVSLIERSFGAGGASLGEVREAFQSSPMKTGV